MKDTLLQVFVDYYTQPNQVPKHECYTPAGSQLCILMGTIDKDTIDQSMSDSAYLCTHYSVFLCHGWFLNQLNLSLL